MLSTNAAAASICKHNRAQGSRNGRLGRRCFSPERPPHLPVLFTFLLTQKRSTEQWFHRLILLSPRCGQKATLTVHRGWRKRLKVEAIRGIESGKSWRTLLTRDPRSDKSDSVRSQCGSLSLSLSLWLAGDHQHQGAMWSGKRGGEGLQANLL